MNLIIYRLEQVYSNVDLDGRFFIIVKDSFVVIDYFLPSTIEVSQLLS